MRTLIVITLCLLSLTCISQVVKSRIGTSVWTKRGKVFADSSISIIINYSRNGKVTSEWQIYRDTIGNIIDTNYVQLDSFERPTHFYEHNEHWYYEYDSLGTAIKITVNRLTDTILILFNPVYHEGKLVKKTISNSIFSLPTTYSYKGRLTIEKQNGLVVETSKRNKLNQIIYSKTEDFNNDVKSITVVKYKRDKKGKILCYKKSKDGVLLKKTIHFFRGELEEYQLEEFFSPSYMVRTKFSYEFW